MPSLSTMSKTKNFKRNVIILFFIVSASVASGFWIYGHYYLSTDDAYLNANVIQMASRISGRINQVTIKNNAYVKRGNVLFEIDSEPYALAVESARAQVAQSEAKLEEVNASAQRSFALVQKHVLPPQTADSVAAQQKAAAAELLFSKARLKQALLNLTYTKVIAPGNGWITNLTLHPGDVVTMNMPLFTLIMEDEFWADANFKETDIAQIKPGQTARIQVDMYPQHPFAGVVDSISGGAGAVFSLLPPQNASGNWVKVTQRVPVKVKILNPDHQHYPLRVGTSATVRITL